MNFKVRLASAIALGMVCSGLILTDVPIALAAFGGLNGEANCECVECGFGWGEFWEVDCTEPLICDEEVLDMDGQCGFVAAGCTGPIWEELDCILADPWCSVCYWLNKEFIER
jgi:hypothetical protein